MNPENSVWKLLKDLETKDGISEIIINDADHVFVEHNGDLVRLNVKLVKKEIEDFAIDVAKMNHRPWNAETLLFDGSLLDGSRVNMVSSVITHSAPAITIRKYQRHIKKFQDSPEIFGLSANWVRFIRALVQARFNILISGGTGSGKTTLLNLLLQEIDPMQRVVTIEDTRELSFDLLNVVRLESLPISGNHHQSVRDLVKNTLRMRPDRIIIGEVRGGEIFDLLQVMNTGHLGSMTTIHANNASEALGRCENLYLMSGFDIPLRALRYQISTAIDVIIQIKRLSNGKRVVSQITEVAGMEQDKILLQDIGMLKDDRLEFTGLAPKKIKRLQEVGIPVDFFTKI